MRDAYPRIHELGGEVVAVGTGNPSMARDLVEDYQVPFRVLIDADARAARAASVEKASFTRLFHPDSFAGTRRAWKGGYRIGVSGARVTQLGATFVVGPGDTVHYTHRDAHSADHAPLDEVLAHLAS